MSKTKRGNSAIKIILVAAVICVGAVIFYLSHCYKATDEAYACIQNEGDVIITEIPEGLLLDGEGEDTALIFYPGAKVECTAYIPLMYMLAQGGIDVFIIKMPCNLAIFGANKADVILGEYDNYKCWYLGGHSLGGAMAANYAAKRVQEGKNMFEGLLLLAAYPTKSLKGSNLDVLTIYGSEDTVLNMSKIENARKLMPVNYREIVISGGNHAQFGCYGEQRGDGTSQISKEEQWTETAELILDTVSCRGTTLQ